MNTEERSPGHLELFDFTGVSFNGVFLSFLKLKLKHVGRGGEIQAGGGGWRWSGQERPHYSVHPGNTHRSQGYVGVGK